MFKRYMNVMMDAEGGAGGGVPPVVAPVVPPVNTGTPWYEGIADVETVGYLQNRGWDKKTAAEAAIEASKAHREAQKFVGRDPAKLLQIPDPNNADEVKAFWTKLGAPADAAGYDLTGVKRADGKDFDPDLAATLKETAAKLNLPADKAVELAKSLAAYQDKSDTSAQADRTAKQQLETAELQKNWGPNFDANKFVAAQAAKALGVDPAAVSALEGQIGYAKVMEMFRNIGVKIGESKYVDGNAPGQTGVMTREQAVATRASLMKDTAWVEGYMKGDTAKAREMTALNVIITGGNDTEWSRAR